MSREQCLSGGVAALSVLCAVLGAVAVALPAWGYFFNPEQALYEQGYFGPWRVCKLLLYSREKCGVDVARFTPSYAVYVSGVCACVCVSLLCACVLLSVLCVSMRVSREPVCMPYHTAVLTRLALSLAAGVLSVCAAGLFAVELDEGARGFVVRRGPAFNLQIACIVLNGLLVVGSVYDALWSRRAGGDPTHRPAATLRNAGYREAAAGRGARGRGGVAVTRASGEPYAGSVASLDTNTTTLTALSDASSNLARSPLRSSLKKPRALGIGIHNPGYAGSSPPPQRNGSVKKVRIQTHSTPV